MANYSTELKSLQPKITVRESAGLHSHDDVREALNAALKPPKKAKGNVEECPPGPYIENVRYRTSGGEAICRHDGKTYKQAFSVDKDGAIRLLGDKVQVQPHTEYEEV